VVAVTGSGRFTVIWVALDGWHLASFGPAGLSIL
jgi:hypothetical protein